MSIKRYLMAGIRVFPRDDGPWVTYDDHVAEVERLTRERDEARAALQAAYAVVKNHDEWLARQDVVVLDIDSEWTRLMDALRAALAALPTPPEQPRVVEDDTLPPSNESPEQESARRVNAGQEGHLMQPDVEESTTTPPEQEA